MHSLAYKTASSAIAAVLGAGVVLAVTALDGGHAPPVPPLAATPPAVSLQPQQPPGSTPGPARTSPAPSATGTQPPAGQQPVLAANVQPRPAAHASRSSPSATGPQPSRPVPAGTQPPASPSPAAAPSPSASASCFIAVKLPVADVCADLAIGG